MSSAGQLSLARYRGRALAISTAGLLALFGLGATPIVAFAHSGTVSASENCDTWSASVSLAHNVTLDRVVEVVTTIPGTTGLTGHYNSSFGLIWSDHGSFPATGTVTLKIWRGSWLEFTDHASISPPAGCVHSPSISTQLSAGSVVVGSAVHDSAVLHGASSAAGGSVTYTVFSDASCTQGATAAGIKTVSNGGVPNSDAVTFNAAGTYYWRAVYSGDVHNLGASSACTEETLAVQKAHAGISTTPSAGGVVGTSVNDSATASGFNPSGSVTYRLYGPGDPGCAGAAVFTDSEAVGAPSKDFTPASAGTYDWTATYGGDGNNLGATSACGDELVTMTSAGGGTQPISNVTGVLGSATFVPNLPKAGAGPAATPGQGLAALPWFVALVLGILTSGIAGRALLAPARQRRRRPPGS